MLVTRKAGVVNEMISILPSVADATTPRITTTNKERLRIMKSATGASLLKLTVEVARQQVVPTIKIHPGGLGSCAVWQHTLQQNLNRGVIDLFYGTAAYRCVPALMSRPG